MYGKTYVVSLEPGQFRLFRVPHKNVRVINNSVKLDKWYQGQVISQALCWQKQVVSQGVRE